MDNADNVDNVAGRDDAASLNPPTGYEKKLAGEKGADKLEGKVEGLGSKGRFRTADVIDDREGQVSEPY
ncbi:hypothetical protein AAVH_08700 [Aphelenchoides avenae]|nr:hypothetical protein AAVH_08700 [Aphelenchus avenae]